MKILISTGIFPPEIGGPAHYAKNLRDEYKRRGFDVSVATFGFERKLPTGLRHAAFFLKIIPSVMRADKIILLDTFSVALPTIIAAGIFNKPAVVRIGGDFLWESYVERTRQSVPLDAFYNGNAYRNAFSRKERAIFRITRHVLDSCAVCAFTTEWQRTLWKDAYGIPDNKCRIVGNFIGKKLPSFEPDRKLFIWAGRPLFLKNTGVLKEAFALAKATDPSLELECIQAAQEVLQAKIAHCYAVIVPSLSEVSPNLVLDSIRHNKPFIVTEHSGLSKEFLDCGLTVDPLDSGDMRDKITELSRKEVYENLKKKAGEFDRVHSWQEIADEFLSLFG